MNKQLLASFFVALSAMTMAVEQAYSDDLTLNLVREITPNSATIGSAKKIACVLTDEGSSVSFIYKKNKGNTPRIVHGEWMMTYGFSQNNIIYSGVKSSGLDSTDHEMFDLYGKNGQPIRKISVFVDDKGGIHLRWFDPAIDKPPYRS